MNAELQTQTQNEKNPCAPSVPSVLPPPPPPAPPAPRRPGRPLSRLLDLSERQLEHINTWLKDEVPFRKIVELCRTEFQREIPYMTFVRYANRTELFRQLDDLTVSKEAAAELSRHAVTGDPSFSTNTLELLESQAFDLAAAHHRDADADDLNLFTKLWHLIHKAKNTAIRDRHATVQENKCALRREELALKTAVALAKLNGGMSSESPTSTTETKTQSTSPSAPSVPPSSVPSVLPPPPRPHPFSTLRPETIAENRQFLEDLLAGKARVTWTPPEIPCPDPKPFLEIMRAIHHPPDPAQPADDSAEPGHPSPTNTLASVPRTC